MQAHVQTQVNIQIDTTHVLGYEHSLRYTCTCAQTCILSDDGLKNMSHDACLLCLEKVKGKVMSKVCTVTVVPGLEIFFLKGL